MERLFEGVPVDIIVDDFLLHGKDEQEMNEKLRLIPEQSRQVGLKFNPAKLKLWVDKVNYVGHVLTLQDYWNLWVAKREYKTKSLTWKLQSCSWASSVT